MSSPDLASSSSLFTIQHAQFGPNEWVITLAPHSQCPPLAQLGRQPVWLWGGNSSAPEHMPATGTLTNAILTTNHDGLPQWELTLHPASQPNFTELPTTVCFPSKEGVTSHLSQPSAPLWQWNDVPLGDPKQLHGHTLWLSGNALGVKRQLLHNLMPQLAGRWLIVDPDGTLATGFSHSINYTAAQLPLARFGFGPLMGAVLRGWPEGFQAEVLACFDDTDDIAPLTTLGDALTYLADALPNMPWHAAISAHSNSKNAEKISPQLESAHQDVALLNLSALPHALKAVVTHQIVDDIACNAPTADTHLHLVWHGPNPAQAATLQDYAATTGNTTVCLSPHSQATKNSVSVIDTHYAWPLEALTTDTIFDTSETTPPHDVELTVSGPLVQNLTFSYQLAGHACQQDYALDLPQLPAPQPLPKLAPSPHNPIRVAEVPLPLPPPAQPTTPQPETPAPPTPAETMIQAAAMPAETTAPTNTDEMFAAFDTQDDTMQAAFLPSDTPVAIHPISSGSPEFESTPADAPTTEDGGFDFDFPTAASEPAQPNPHQAVAVADKPPEATITRPIADTLAVFDDTPNTPPLTPVASEPNLNTAEQPTVIPSTPALTHRQAAYVATPTATHTPNGGTDYAKGQRVQHPRYGQGTIQHLIHTGGRTTLRVQFDTVGKRLLDADQANLSAL